MRDEKTVDITPEGFKTLLHSAELTTIEKSNNHWKFPYEYICWRNLLIDIDFEDRKLDEILQTEVKPTSADKIFNKLDELRFSSRWFLDINYSNEFNQLLKSLKDANNLDNLIDENIEKIFNDEEKDEWTKKILTSAYIKYAIGKGEDASLIYGLALSKENKTNLYKEILKRSIYEYLMVVKYDKNVNSYGLTHEEINDKIKYIEEKWVSNV